MMFEDLDKFIAENPEEVLVTGGWTDDKISELEKQLSIAFREEVKIFIRKYGVLIGYGVEIVNWGLDNLEVYPEAESLESFVLAQFKEGKMNW